MKKDHVGFVIFLFFLLITPKIPLGISIFPQKSAMPLGFVGLLIWMFLSPRHILRKKLFLKSSTSLRLLIFGIYAFFVSIISLNLTSIAFSFQYLFYLFMSYSLLSSYLNDAAYSGEIHKTYKIFSYFGVIFTFAVIISVWTGPFYQHQTIYVSKNWQDIPIRQGIGFMEGGSGAGAVLIVFCLFFFIIYRRYHRIGLFWGIIAFIALITTLSRSAVFSFIIGSIIYLFIACMRSIKRGRILRKTVFMVFEGISAVIIITLIWEGILLCFANRSILKDTMVSIGSGFALLRSEIAQGDIETRKEIWHESIDKWGNSTIRERILGNGFRSHGNISDDLVAWSTPHNVYIALLIDFGLIGFLLFIFPLLLFVITHTIRFLSGKESAAQRFALVVIMCLLMHNFTETFFYSPILMSLLLLSIILASLDMPKPMNLSQARTIK